jgi:hypothetical protein
MESILPGLVPSPAYLLDERGRPDFRDAFGALAARASQILTAVTRVRLSTVDLRRHDLPELESMQVLVSEMSALSLDSEARGLMQMPGRAPNVRFLIGLLEEGCLEVRSAPLGGWAPDFTVFVEPEGPRAVMLGFHAFERPYPHRGPALASLHGGDGARLAAIRHRELWESAHDVGPALWSILSRAERRATHAMSAG